MSYSVRYFLAFSLFGSLVLQAAPSLELPSEWYAPLENEAGFVLVQKETGQARIMLFNGAGQLTQLGPVETSLPNVTGLSTGLDAANTEMITVSSVTGNAVRILDSTNLALTTLTPDTPGPVTAIPFRELPGDAPGVVTHGFYHSSGQDLQIHDDVLSGSPSILDEVPVPTSFHSLQSMRIPGTSERGGLFIFDNSGSGILYQTRRSGGGFDFDALVATDIDRVLSPEVLGDDGRTCAVGFRSGETNAEIITLPYSGFPTGVETSNNVGFPIGTVVGIPPTVPNGGEGVLITSKDRNVAAYATVASGKEFVIKEQFTPGPDFEITGLVPVPQVGFLVLQGKFKGDGDTVFWDLYQNGGGGWQKTNSGFLSNWLGAQANFATLFWFNGEPLVDPVADILKIETYADWTRKLSNDPIAKVELSDLSDAVTGLSPTSTHVPTIPSGATHLMANQFEDRVSISALGSDLALLTPSVSISPDSGNYTTSVTVTALYNSGANDLFYREATPGTAWEPFETLTIGYPSTWLFYARNKSTGATGPIIQRTFSFPGVNLNEIDSDGDTIPDYVERELKLDPAGGTDSDGDFQSDLEEIVGSTDPADHLSNIPAASRNPPFLGEGFELIAQAFNRLNQGASPYNEFSGTTIEDDFPGEILRAYAMTGELLAEENVVELTAPAGLAGQDGAAMSVASPIPSRSWITLATPTYFNVLDLLTPPRTGRENFKVMSRPVNPVPTVVTVPTGSDRAADAAAWIAAAQTAHTGFELVSSLAEIHPEDTVVAALAEQALFDSLQSLPAGDQVGLGIPSSVKDFTLFPFRDGEAAKTPFSEEMYQALLNGGCDFSAMIAVLEGAAGNPTIVSFANLIEATHVSNGASNPLMALPLDVYRSILRNGSIEDPAPGDPARTNPYDSILASSITAVETEFTSLLGLISGTKRPTAIWNLVIEPATTPLHLYDYRRSGNNALAWLMDSFGERVQLEQGLGLTLNAVYTVVGFTDVTGPAGFDAMEVIRVESIVVPLSTDTDTNGNLLDDGWEEVFFGQLGSVGPFDPHPLTGHTYLQYHIEGEDPRAGTLIGPVETMMPINLDMVWVQVAGAYDFEFDFPDAYLDNFDFTLEASPTVQGFVGPANVGGITKVGPNRYSFRVSAANSNLDANFFRIGMILKTL